jgi:hypothetical protein
MRPDPRINPFHPVLRAERGAELRQRSDQQWEALGERGHRHEESALHDLFHFLVADVPRDRLVERTADVLGRLAADAVVDRAVSEGGRASDEEIWRLQDRLARTVGVRHWGDPDEWRS